MSPCDSRACEGRTSSFAEYRVLAQSPIGCRPAEYAGAQVPCHYNAIAIAFGSPNCALTKGIITVLSMGGERERGANGDTYEQRSNTKTNPKADSIG